jgi:uncharacterized protein
MNRKTVRSAKTQRKAVRSRRSPRKASVKASPAKRKRPTAKRKPVLKKPARTSVRARKPAALAPKAKRTRKSSPAPAAAKPLSLGFKELSTPPTPVAIPAPSAEPALPPLHLPAGQGAAESGQRPAPAGPQFPIPPILLEGDEPVRPEVTGPAEKYALGLTAPVQSFERKGAELPQAYGTGKLFLVARDPHCLYAHWDLAESQQRQAQALVLRVYRDTIAGDPVTETRPNPASRHQFVQVERAGARYLAELGYYQLGGGWVPVAVSESVLTPPETVAEDKSVRWATVPVFAPRPNIQEPKRELAVTEAAYRREGARTEGWLPGRLAAPPAPNGQPAPAAQLTEWTPAQQRALEEVVGVALAQQRGTGSAEILELLGPEVRRAEAQLNLPGPAGRPVSISSAQGLAPLGISSPAGGQAAAPRGFWFNVNAELIIYGATEPDARVTIGGRPLRLRPDGTFSCRFALPDGRYDLAVAAVSVHEEMRRADLAFSRRTDYQGEVGAHPQDKALKPPAAENVPTI